MGQYENKTVPVVLIQIDDLLDKMNEIGASKVRIANVCDKLSIGDWFKTDLLKTNLEEMKKFLLEAESLGFDGHCEFCVGTKDSRNGMWAFKCESTNGYAPTGDYIYKSFSPAQNYWDIVIGRDILNDLEGVSVALEYGEQHSYNDLNTINKLEKSYESFKKDHPEYDESLAFNEKVNEEKEMDNEEMEI